MRKPQSTLRKWTTTAKYRNVFKRCEGIDLNRRHTFGRSIRETMKGFIDDSTHRQAAGGRPMQLWQPPTALNAMYYSRHLRSKAELPFRTKKDHVSLSTHRKYSTKQYPVLPLITSTRQIISSFCASFCKL